MATKPKASCRCPGCPALHTNRVPYCDQHKRDADRTNHDPEAVAFYHSPVWKAVRRKKLAANPLCEECERRGRVTAAAHVHHVEPLRKAPERRLDLDNLESLCVRCHSRETAYEVWGKGKRK